MIKWLIIIIMFTGIDTSFGYGSAQNPETSFDPLHLHIEWKFITNNYNNTSKFLAALTLVNKDRQPVSKTGWKLYFSLRYHGKLQSQGPDFKIHHINGDLFCLEPTPSFNGLPPGQPAVVKFSGDRIIANYQDMPSGIFWVDATDKAFAIPDSNIATVPGTLAGANALEIFNQNTGTTDIPLAKIPAIIPQPVSIHRQKGYFLWGKQTDIVSTDDFSAEAAWLSQQYQTLTGSAPASIHGDKSIVLQKNNLPDEDYDLEVTPNKMVISASGGAGIFYGMQSLINLLPPDVWSAKRAALAVPCVVIHDRPRFPVRAFMLDVSRNFQSKQEIFKLLDLMALYKLNTFHFHFSDDEGWRIEIPGLPELTSVGSQRGYPFDQDQRLQPSYGSGPSTADKMGSGYYTRNDFIEILKYAKARHIQVIPEIESPGHARAAVRSMLARYRKYIKTDRKKAEEYLLTDLRDSSVYSGPQAFNDNVMNPGLPSTYHFMKKVSDELLAMYKDAGAKITMMHMGGDEVPDGTWERSPLIKVLRQKDTSLHSLNDVFLSYFMNLQKMLNRNNLTLYGWDVIGAGRQKGSYLITVKNIPGFIDKKVTVDAAFNIYGNEGMPYQLANTGYKTILTFFDYFYFDLAYQPSFYEPGDEWLGLLDTKKVLSFIPYDYYRNTTVDIAGKPIRPGYFDKKAHLSPNGRKNIIGIQGVLWGENIRSARQMEYMIVPRLLALAQKAWAKAPAWETEADTAKATGMYGQYWNVFANQLGKIELPKLTVYHGGYYFRIPAAGIKETNGMITANQQLPGMTIRYTTNGAEPEQSSFIYSRPIKLKGHIKMKIFDNKGRSGETTAINAN